MAQDNKAPQGQTTLEQLQEAVLRMQLKSQENILATQELEKIQKLESESEAKAARLIGANAYREERTRILNTQGGCPHLKPNAQPAIGGQWDHHGTYHWICAYCAKEWQDNDLPIHLRISQDFVGGPTR